MDVFWPFVRRMLEITFEIIVQPIYQRCLGRMIDDYLPQPGQQAAVQPEVPSRYPHSLRDIRDGVRGNGP